MQLGPAITSKSNARVKALRASFSGKASAPGELLGLEGEHLISEAARSGLRIETVFIRQGDEDVVRRSSLASLRAQNFIVLTPEIFTSAVDTGSPQGIAALIEIPDASKPSDNARGLYLIAEAIQDPGNLGTLLRTAEAFGFQRVFLSSDTVNPWNPKTVRASAGSVFRVPVERIELKQAKAWCSARKTKVIAAVARSEKATSSVAVDLSGSCAVIVGNEGAGLSREAIALADELVHIPCMTESLNAAVAGAVLMYEAMRQHMTSSMPGAVKK
jgi:RNA methyltransferase, TrmH family